MKRPVLHVIDHWSIIHAWRVRNQIYAKFFSHPSNQRAPQPHWPRLNRLRGNENHPVQSFRQIYRARKFRNRIIKILKNAKNKKF